MAEVGNLAELSQDPTFRGLPDPDKITLARELFAKELRDTDDTALRQQLGIPMDTIRASGPAESAAGTLANFGPFGQFASNILQAATDPTTASATVADVLTRMTPLGATNPALPQLASGAAATGVELLRGRSLSEATARGGQEMGAGIVGEGVARGAQRASLLFREGAGTMSQRLTPDAQAAINFLEPRGVQVLPSEATETVLLDLAQNLAEGGFLSAGRMSRFQAARTQSIKKVANGLLDEIGPNLSPGQMAALFVDETRGQNAMAKLFSNEMRSEFRAQAGHLTADVSVLRDIGRRIVEESAGRKDVGSQLVGLPTARRLAKLGRQASKDAPPLLSIDELDDLRQLLGDIKRQKELGQRPPQRIQNLMDRAIKEIDNLIEETADPRALELYRQSNRLVAERFKTTDSDFLKKLVKLSDPLAIGKGGASGGDALVDAVFANADTIAAARRALGDSPEMRTMERRFMQRQFANVTDATGKIDGAALEKALVGTTGEFGDRFTAQLARPEQRQNVLRFAQALKTLQNQQRSKIGSVAVQLTQGGIIIGALTGRAAPTTAALAFIPPSVIAEMLLSKRTARMLLRTIETPRGVKATTAAIGRIVAETNRIAMEQKAEAVFGDRSKARTPSFRAQFEQDRDDEAEAGLVSLR